MANNYKNMENISFFSGENDYFKQIIYDTIKYGYIYSINTNWALTTGRHSLSCEGKSKEEWCTTLAPNGLTYEKQPGQSFGKPKQAMWEGSRFRGISIPLIVVLCNCRT